LKKKKIIFSIPNFITAGSGREMFNIVERLDLQEFDPFISVEHEGGNLYQEIRQKGYNILNLKHSVNQNSSRIEKLLSAIKIGIQYRKYKFDIWQSFHWSSNYYEPIIARIAGAKYIYVKKNMNWGKAWWLKSFLSNHIIARNSSMMKKYFGVWPFLDKSTFITGAVDLEKFKVQNVSIHYRSLFKSNEQTKIVTCIAQILRIKNQLLLAKAIKEIPHIVLLLAGAERDSVYADEIRKFIHENALESKVFLLGNVSNTVDLLNETDIFVLPTNTLNGHEEGCPVALLEAMACGVTCIASNIAGNIDLISDGLNGYIFESDDIESLKLKINVALLHPKTIQEKMNSHDLNLESQKFQNLYLGMDA